MKTDVFNHGPAKLFANTGSPRFGRPSMGAWVTYGIGSEVDSLPGFVVLLSGPRGPRGGAPLWGSGFLPTTYQGVAFLNGSDPILNLSNPAGRRPPSAGRIRGRRPRSQFAAAQPGPRSGNFHADRRVRDGLPHAVERPRADGPGAGDEADARRLRCRPGRSRRSPATACWPAGWSRRAAVSCSSITPIGTITATRARTWASRSTTAAARSTGRRPL